MTTTTPMMQKIFVVIAKQDEKDNPFFAEVHKGCDATAAKLNQDAHDENETRTIVCDFRYPTHPVVTEQMELFQQVLTNYTGTATTSSSSSVSLAGIAIAPLADDTGMAVLIQQALEAGIPVVTFDSDAPKSNRLLYIGTNNVLFGRTLGKILVQLRPDGGQVGVLGAGGDNLARRQHGLAQELQNNRARNVVWNLAAPPAMNMEESPGLALTQIDGLLDTYPSISAIVSLAGWPMFDDVGWKQLVDKYQHRNITYIVADTFQVQLDLLKAGYVDALVGQDPYSMGAQTILQLDKYYSHGSFQYVPTAPSSASSLVQTNNNNVYGTVFFEMVRVPFTLPPPALANNAVGNLRYLGYTYFAIVVLTSVAAAVWTIRQNDTRVVIAAQPQFLLLVCFGALVFAVSILLLSFDDTISHAGGNENDLSLSLEMNDPLTEYDRWSTYCTAFPWFAELGFTIMFSALLSKTRSINKVFRNTERQERVQVSQRDLYLPLIVLLLLNIANMTAWTIMAPLQYVRKAHAATDDWNNVISYYGICATRPGDEALPFIIIMTVLNFGALVFANWQAYQARTIESEFQESRFIAIAMVFLLQAVLIGAPLLALVRETPRAFYVVLTTMFFTVILTVLLLLFVPKFILVRKHIAEQTLEKQKHLDSLRKHRLRLEHKKSQERRMSSTTNSTPLTHPSSEKTLEVDNKQESETAGSSMDFAVIQNDIRCDEAATDTILPDV